MTPYALRALADEATPGRWEASGTTVLVYEAAERPRAIAGTGLTSSVAAPHHYEEAAADARLIALTPELARLLADMADALEEYDAQCECGTCLKARDLLARFRSLGEPE